MKMKSNFPPKEFIHKELRQICATNIKPQLDIIDDYLKTILNNSVYCPFSPKRNLNCFRL